MVAIGTGVIVTNNDSSKFNEYVEVSAESRVSNSRSRKIASTQVAFDEDIFSIPSENNQAIPQVMNSDENKVSQTNAEAPIQSVPYYAALSSLAAKQIDSKMRPDREVASDIGPKGDTRGSPSGLPPQFLPKNSSTSSSSIINTGSNTNVSSSSTTTSTTISITLEPNKLYPLSGSDTPLLQGTEYTLATAADSDGDSVTLSCTYETLGLSSSDPNYAPAGTNCTSLLTLITESGILKPSTVTFATPSFIWKPTYAQKGTFKFTFSATDGTETSSSSVLYATVRENYLTTNLLSALEAIYSDGASAISSTPSIPRLDTGTNDNVTSWMDLMGNQDGDLSGFGSSAPWSGLGTSSSPYGLNFNGTSDTMSLGSALSGKTKVMFSSWISPSSASTKNKVIFGTGGADAGGFVLKQSELDANKIELIVGKKQYSSLILAEGPVRYYRFNEASGTTLTDYSTSASNATLSATGVSYTQTGALTGDSNKTMTFDGTSGGVTLDTPIIYTHQTNFTLEAWYKGTDTETNSSWGKGLIGWDDNSGATGLVVRNGYIEYLHYNPTATWDHDIKSTTLIADGNWHHIVYVGKSNQTGTLYIDGVAEVTDIDSTQHPSFTTVPLYHLMRTYNGKYTSGSLDEVAIYDYDLSAQQVYNHYRAGQNIFPTNKIMAKGPQAYWKLNETSGTTAYDQTVNALHGTYSGTQKLNVAGALSDSADRASEFDGSTTKVDVPYSAKLNTAKFTVLGWVKLSGGASYRGPITSRTGGDGIVTYVNAAGVWEAWVGNAGWQVITGPAAVLNTWTFIALTYDGTTLKFYVNNGAPYTLVTGYSLNTTQPFRLGAGVTEAAGQYFWPGMIDDVAVYSRALSATDISDIYTATNDFKCQSSTVFANSVWNNISAIWNGTNAKLYVNGREECSVTPGTTFTPSTDFIAGSAQSTNFWSGAIANLKLYGTSDGSAAGTATNIQDEFKAGANTFRKNPIGSIVTSGLVLQLDAVSGKNGFSPHSSGCADSSQLEWFDLSFVSPSYRLVRFADCASYGWKGSGINTDPYVLRFKSSTHPNQYNVQIPFSASLNLNTTGTVELWVKTSQCAGVNMLWARYGSVGLALNCASNVYPITHSADAGITTLTDPVVSDGNWHHIVVAFSHNIASRDSSIYVDGIETKRFSFDGTAAPFYSWLLGGDNTGYATSTLEKDVNYFAIYNTKLTIDQIKQNCHAMKPRFSSAVCN